VKYLAHSLFSKLGMFQSTSIWSCSATTKTDLMEAEKRSPATALHIATYLEIIPQQCQDEDVAIR